MRGACLALDPAADVHEVARRKSYRFAHPSPDFGRRAPEVPAGDARLDRDSPAARLPADGAWPECLLDVRELAERNSGAVVPVHEERPERGHVAAPVVLEPHDEVEAPLPEPHLRLLLADEPDPDGANHVPRREPDAGDGMAVDAEPKLREAGQLLDAQVRDALHAAHHLPNLLAETHQLVEIGAEDAERKIRRRPAEPLVDSHAERRREERRDARNTL